MDSSLQLTVDNLKFTVWILGSVVSLAFLYVKLYIRSVLHDQQREIYRMIDIYYVRRDVHEEQMRLLKVMINEGA